jgi:hypothetical protein
MTPEAASGAVPQAAAVLLIAVFALAGVVIALFRRRRSADATPPLNDTRPKPTPPTVSTPKPAPAPPAGGAARADGDARMSACPTCGGDGPHAEATDCRTPDGLDARLLNALTHKLYRDIEVATYYEEPLRPIIRRSLTEFWMRSRNRDD